MKAPKPSAKTPRTLDRRLRKRAQYLAFDHDMVDGFLIEQSTRTFNAPSGAGNGRFQTTPAVTQAFKQCIATLNLLDAAAEDISDAVISVESAPSGRRSERIQTRRREVLQRQLSRLQNGRRGRKYKHRTMDASSGLGSSRSASGATALRRVMNEDFIFQGFNSDSDRAFELELEEDMAAADDENFHSSPPVQSRPKKRSRDSETHQGTKRGPGRPPKKGKPGPKPGRKRGRPPKHITSGAGVTAGGYDSISTAGSVVNARAQSWVAPAKLPQVLHHRLLGGPLPPAAHPEPAARGVGPEPPPPPPTSADEEAVALAEASAAAAAEEELIQIEASKAGQLRQGDNDDGDAPNTLHPVWEVPVLVNGESVSRTCYCGEIALPVLAAPTSIRPVDGSPIVEYTEPMGPPSSVPQPWSNDSRRAVHCSSCHAFFHTACVSHPLAKQVLWGDSAYTFVCKHCSGSSTTEGEQTVQGEEGLMEESGLDQAAEQQPPACPLGSGEHFTKHELDWRSIIHIALCNLILESISLHQVVPFDEEKPRTSRKFRVEETEICVVSTLPVRLPSPGACFFSESAIVAFIEAHWDTLGSNKTQGALWPGQVTGILQVVLKPERRIQHQVNSLLPAAAYTRAARMRSSSTGTVFGELVKAPEVPEEHPASGQSCLKGDGTDGYMRNLRAILGDVVYLKPTRKKSFSYSLSFARRSHSYEDTMLAHGSRCWVPLALLLHMCRLGALPRPPYHRRKSFPEPNELLALQPVNVEGQKVSRPPPGDSMPGPGATFGRLSESRASPSRFRRGTQVTIARSACRMPDTELRQGRKRLPASMRTEPVHKVWSPSTSSDAVVRALSPLQGSKRGGRAGRGRRGGRGRSGRGHSLENRRRKDPVSISQPLNDGRWEVDIQDVNPVASRGLASLSRRAQTHQVVDLEDM